jgi:hypothetical protein
MTSIVPFADELGTDLAPELRELHQRILRGQPARPRPHVDGLPCPPSRRRPPGFPPRFS